MLCIFCLNERAPSEEHIFPAAIGGALVIDRVCLPCNNWLGTHVDALLTDHALILLKRAQLGMRDSKGNIIDPWKKVFKLGTMANDSEQKVKLITDSETGQLVPKLIYKRSILNASDNGRPHTVQITIDARQANELGKIIQRERKRDGMPPLSDEALQTQVETVKSNSDCIAKPEIRFSPEIDIQNYFRAIYKIAYELAWLWLGDEYLYDPIAIQLRNVVLKGVNEEIKGRAELGVIAPLELWNKEPNAHIGLSMQVENGIAISIRIFDSISGVVAISETKNKYPNICEPSQLGRFILNDSLTGALRNSTLADELHRMTNELRV